MDKIALDAAAVEYALISAAREAILGMFGDKDESSMINKMHNMIEMADRLRVKDLTIQVNLKDLRKAKKQYEVPDEEVTKDE